MTDGKPEVRLDELTARRLRELPTDSTATEDDVRAATQRELVDGMRSRPMLGALRGVVHRAPEDPKSDGVYLLRADEIRPEHVEWFEDGLIPLRTVTLGTGIDGVGKSTIFTDRIARASRGQLPGAFYGRPVDSVIASSEDHAPSVIVPRLIAAGADLSRVHVIEVRRDGTTGDMALPDDLPEIERAVSGIDARFLLIDPLVAHMPMAIDSHKAQHVRQVLAPLARLAEEAHMATLCIVHFNGGQGADVRSRISGSKALRDASRSVLVCGVDPTDESRYVVVQDKNSYGPKSRTGRAYRIEEQVVEHNGERFKTAAVAWLGEVEVDGRSLLAGPEAPEERSALDEAIIWLRAYLDENGGTVEASTAKTAARDAGIRDRTLDRARPRVARTERGGFPARSVWTLLTVSPTPPGETVNPTPGETGETVALQGETDPPSPQARQPQDAGETGLICDVCGAPGARPYLSGDRCSEHKAVAS